MGFEDQIPPIPNRDQEKRYIATVEKSFYDQPLYKFYMNEALRERKMDYADKLNTFKYEWILNFAASGMVFSLLYFIPVSYFYRQTSTGVPTYYQPKNKAVFKQGYLQNQNWRRFKLYSFLVFGSAFIFAHTYTDRSQIHDEYYNNVGVIKPKFE
ncbi:unnamed protein product (macronuclear) [Paramecium tetraurelia]|uniref:Transmembrane protein n=1 Tax=Paramecium tetraurelia TaxID=5888 RepID=A0DS97_PARTE|nr:uncharacterized protein GSPATT00019618001 [Paramecium tetraurelia]CAK85914.1 unnamed protein product [Paramecium tetraurelia]|eukprot:XP_001453311.1 hypothetical protein (macronuclear) [Paramecium tetraurelia strain d4-2]